VREIVNSGHSIRILGDGAIAPLYKRRQVVQKFPHEIIAAILCLKSKQGQCRIIAQLAVG
jgi:hypothetical protein